MDGTVPLVHYLWTRLRQLGIESLHGLPGDYNLLALDYLPGADLKWVGDANELNAGYAADGYARVKGMGAILTTYGVGELSAINAIAGSYAEYVPVVHIVGAPSTEAQKDGRLLHHTLGNGDFHVFGDIYKRVTVAQAYLHDPKTATAEIDAVLKECWVQSRPVYIELPTDMVLEPVNGAPLSTPPDISYPENEPAAQQAAVGAILDRLYAAKKPCVLVDGCVLRRQLLPDVDAFLRRTNLPVFVSPMGKSAVNEGLPNFCGMYAGSGSLDCVRDYVENSDLVLTIGTIKSDFNTAGFSYRVSTLNSIDLHTGIVSIGYANYSLQMRGVIHSLTALCDPAKLSIEPFVAAPGRAAARSLEVVEYPGGTITHAYLWPRLSDWLRPGDVLLTETGTAYLGVWDTSLPKDSLAISQTLWGSIGYTLPAAQGAALAAREQAAGAIRDANGHSSGTVTRRRVILFEGDGSFQLTAQSIGTMLALGLDLVVFLINNSGYCIERYVHGMEEKYNDVPGWRYAEVPSSMGGKEGHGCSTYQVRTTEQLEDLWKSGRLDEPKGLHFIEMQMPKEDAPETLKMFFKK